MATDNRKSVVERIGQALKERAKEGLQQSLVYGKEVATGKKLMEGLSQQDGAFEGWMAHGSTELANMLLHGHPAPVYARSLSPADIEGEPQVTPQQDADNSMSMPQHDNSRDLDTSHPIEPSGKFRSSLASLFGPSQECSVNQTVQKKMSR